ELDYFWGMQSHRPCKNCRRLGPPTSTSACAKCHSVTCRRGRRRSRLKAIFLGQLPIAGNDVAHRAGRRLESRLARGFKALSEMDEINHASHGIAPVPYGSRSERGVPTATADAHVRMRHVPLRSMPTSTSPVPVKRPSNSKIVLTSSLGTH